MTSLPDRAKRFEDRLSPAQLAELTEFAKRYRAGEFKAKSQTELLTTVTEYLGVQVPKRTLRDAIERLGQREDQ